jgi:uncharacterized protein (TIGR03067 family)
MKQDSEARRIPSAWPAAMVGAFIHFLVWLGVLFPFALYAATIERTYRSLSMSLPATSGQVFAVSRFCLANAPLTACVLSSLMIVDALVLWALDRPGGLRILREIWASLTLGLPFLGLVFTVFAVSLPWVKVSEGLLQSMRSRDKAVQAEQGLLAGRWKLISVERDGNVGPPADVFAGQLTLRGEQLTWLRGEQEVGGLYSLELRGNPKQITIMYTEGPEAGQSQSGLYKLEGDRLTICLAPVDAIGDDLPAEFPTRGTHNEVTIWQRQP